MRSHLVVALLLALLVPREVRAGALETKPIEVRETRDAHGHAGVLLTFKRHSPEQQAPLTLQEVHLLLAAFERRYGRQKPLPPVAFPGPLRMTGVGMQLAAWRTGRSS